MISTKLKKVRRKKIPRGFKLRHTLRGHENVISRIAWSPDGRMIASPSLDMTIRIWDAETGELRQTLEGHIGSVESVAWSPDGRKLASGSLDQTIRVWAMLGSAKKGTDTPECLNILKAHTNYVFSVAWKPDGRMLASGSFDGTMRLWNVETGESEQILELDEGSVNSIVWAPDGRFLASAQDDADILISDIQGRELLCKLKGHSAGIYTLAWSSDGKTLASGSVDKTIRIWDTARWQQKTALEAHTSTVRSVSFSSDNRLLASKSWDGSVRLWRCDTWETVAVLPEPASANWPPGLAFHPKAPVLATLGEEDSVIRIWDLDFDVLLGAEPVTPSVHYTNAKVVFVGETSTGKTCLARSLMGEPFKPQESTHGMKVWNFRSETAKRPEGGKTTRETLLWDLAGQTDYQVVHQLFLDETALGIILFDPTHPENPFGGVSHWEKALQRAVGDHPKLLVAGRVDRGHPTATPDDIEAFRNKHGFSEFISTSAKTTEGVEQLREAIARAVPWDKLPVTSSPELWKDIREYLLERRKGKEVLSRRSDLQEAFHSKYPKAEFTDAEFDTVIGHAQVQGLLWRLSFGDFVLMKPELLNDYASAVVRVARKHPKGLGCVNERDVLEAKIDFEDLKRLPDTETERSLLHAVVELFLEKEVALREGGHLVFPSKFNRERPEYPGRPLREVAYVFAGPVEDIYATLVVRLSYCGAFELKHLWKNAAEFTDSVGKVCDFVLSTPAEGQGQIYIFFDKTASVDSKVLFLQFIHEHLQKRALMDSVQRERVYRCECGKVVEDKQAVDARLQMGKKAITCQYCDRQIQLIDLLEEKFGDPELLRRVRELEEQAEEKKDREVGVTTTKAKEEIREFDVFLAHNTEDKQQVIALAEQLRGRGLNPWLDVEQIPPGRWFQDIIQKTIPKVKSAAVIIGSKGLGKWQTLELRSFISQCVESDLPVIPVLLPGVKRFPKELLFLKELRWVRFAEHIDETEPLNNLEWGVTGERPQRKLR